MALTTSDELQKQLTVIFGFNGQLQIEVGHIIGIGKLSGLHTELLIKQMLNFLQSYNAMLRDYAGCELYSIEFALESLDPTASQLKILPKGMLFVPGEFKDCNTLLLMLSNEMSLLDNENAKNSVDNLGQLFFEVEEAANRDELSKDQRKTFLNKFARRFALKLQGDYTDGKWNRKLVGLKSEDSMDIESQSYLTLNMKSVIRADKAHEIEPFDPRFSPVNLRWSQEDLWEFMKHQILPSAALVIAENTMKMTANLLQIANTGTIDDVQQQILVIFLNAYLEREQQNPQTVSFNEFKDQFLAFLPELRSTVADFHKNTSIFCKSGEVGTMDELITTFNTMFTQNNTADNSIQNQLFQILKKLMENSMVPNKPKLRAIEFQSICSYLHEACLEVLKIIEQALPRYFRYYLLTNYASKFIDLLYTEFKTQKKPVMALGYKYIEKFAIFLSNRIARMSLFNEKDEAIEQNLRNNSNLKQNNIHSIFQALARELIEPFISEIEITASDLLGFVEIMLTSLPEATEHIKKLQRFKEEIERLWGLILRASSINRFLKGLDPESPLEPEQFTTQFIEFLRKRLGGFDLVWQDYVFFWIEEYGYESQQQYLADKENKNPWPKTKIVENFIKYINERIQDELTIEGFKKPMKQYLDKFAQNFENRNIIEIANSYDLSLEFVEQFPDFIRQIFSKTIEDFADPVKKQSQVVFLGPLPQVDYNENESSVSDINNPISDEEIGENIDTEPEATALFRLSSPLSGKAGLFNRLSFYDFIIETEMKYFSKLIAKPTVIELKSIDHDSFNGKEFRQHLEYKYWDKFFKMYISSNFQDVKVRFK